MSKYDLELHAGQVNKYDLQLAAVSGVTYTKTGTATLQGVAVGTKARDANKTGAGILMGSGAGQDVQVPAQTGGMPTSVFQIPLGEIHRRSGVAAMVGSANGMRRRELTRIGQARLAIRCSGFVERATHKAGTSTGSLEVDGSVQISNEVEEMALMLALVGV